MNNINYDELINRIISKNNNKLFLNELPHKLNSNFVNEFVEINGKYIYDEECFSDVKMVDQNLYLVKFDNQRWGIRYGYKQYSENTYDLNDISYLGNGYFKLKRPISAEEDYLGYNMFGDSKNNKQYSLLDYKGRLNEHQYRDISYLSGDFFAIEISEGRYMIKNIKTDKIGKHIYFNIFEANKGLAKVENRFRSTYIINLEDETRAYKSDRDILKEIQNDYTQLFFVPIDKIKNKQFANKCKAAAIANALNKNSSNKAQIVDCIKYYVEKNIGKNNQNNYENNM